MQHSVAIEQIEPRAAAINLTLKRLARAADLTPSTAYRATSGIGDTRASTGRKLSAALAAEELRLLAHLAALHPQAAMEAATVALCPQKRDAA